MGNISNRNSRRKSSTLSEVISVSLGLHEQGQTKDGQNLSSLLLSNVQYGGDSFVTSGSNRDYNHIGRTYASGLLSRSPANEIDPMTLPITNNARKPITVTDVLHKQTAQLSENFNDPTFNEENMDVFLDMIDNKYDNDSADEHTPENSANRYTGEDDKVTYLPINSTFSNIDETEEIAGALLTPSSSFLGDELEMEANYDDINGEYQSIPKATSRVNIQKSNDSILFQMIHYIPASILGLLLNILDALSYGMIIFPITEPVFANLGTSGISMFYISTIICQLILSGGFSSFPCGIGSEMIEITPFYHTMALAINNALPGKDNEVISTTIFCYVISSLITGLVFFTLGRLRLGKIVGFFPRHILIGCIGGVGYFLIITGLEVTTRASKVEYNRVFLTFLFSDFNIFGKWFISILLSTTLIFTQRSFQNSLVLPSFYIITLILFHFIVAIFPNLSLDQLRDTGWIFSITGSNSNWYDHYKYFNVHDVSWSLIIKQLPTMLALTFFGILHVPINVPALAMSLHMDKYDVDKELIAHGYSNFISGMFGSVQNYLVYTNSVLFIRAGADSPLAGYILAGLTLIVMIIGPVIVSFIPICIVGSLIFLLGYELVVEALIDTLGKVTTFEYITILIIVLTMGIYDFVLGISVGILIACLSFMVDGTNLQTINGEFNGTVAKSTVYRDFIQTKFLNGIREQIYLLKLQNVLFFGTIISIEEKIDKLLELSNIDSSKRRIKYLILDFKNINADNIDYSAAEGFNRIKRFTQGKRIHLIISSIKESDQIYNSFNKVGLLEDVGLFDDLNNALEWCENEFLSQYKQLHDKAKERIYNRMSIVTERSNLIGDINQTNSMNRNSTDRQRLMSMPTNTPRNHQILSVARNVFKNEAKTANKFKNQSRSKEPILPLLLFSLRLFRPDIFSEDKKVRDNETKFWAQLAPYFKRLLLLPGSSLPDTDNFFFIVEYGVVRVKYDFPQGSLFETMLNRTCYGKIIGQRKNSSITQKITFVTETETSIWLINASCLDRLRNENIEVYAELSLLVMSIREYRFRGLVGYTLVSA